MFVENRRIYTAGEYIYNMFEDAADKHFYLCSDKVADFSRISCSLCSVFTNRSSSHKISTYIVPTDNT